MMLPLDLPTIEKSSRLCNPEYLWVWLPLDDLKEDLAVFLIFFVISSNLILNSDSSVGGFYFTVYAKIL